MEKMNSVKDMLASGMDPNELIKNLKDEINAAINELNAESESKKASALNTARGEAAQAFYNYLIALGVISEEVIDVAEIAEILKAMEDEVKAFATEFGIKPKSRGKRTEVLKRKEITPEDEDIIRDFLKSLR